MFEELLKNLANIGYAMLIFLSAYLANVAFSLWYNIKIQNQQFDKGKLLASALKIVVFVVGLALLCVAITALPLFANQVGWAIPEEYADVFASLIIISAVLLVSCKYIKEAFEKFTAILNTQTEITAARSAPQAATGDADGAGGVNGHAEAESPPQPATEGGGTKE